MPNSRLDTLRTIDPVLTTLAHRYSNNSMVAGYLFPHVQVSDMKGKIPIFGKEAFIVRETDRAIRSDSNRIPPSEMNLIEFETTEKDVEIAIDYLEQEESNTYLKYEEHISRQLVDILSLGKEKEAADIALAQTNYASDMKTVITSGEAFDDDTNTTDPIEVIRSGMSAVRNKIARYPNVMIIGDATYQALLNHAKIQERVKYSGISTVNTRILSELTDIPNIHIGMSVYSNDGSTFTDVWSDNIVLAYVDMSDKTKRSEYNPSYGYTFQREGKPEIDTYYENGGKIKVIRNTDNYAVKVVASDAAYLIADTNHS